MKKILVISNNYPPYFDGISFYTKNLCSELSNNGYEIKSLNFNRDTSMEAFNFLDLFYTKPTKNSYYSLFNILNPFTLFNNEKGFRNYVFTNMVFRISNKMIRDFKPDLIHVIYPRLFSAVVNSKIPIVFTAHSEEIKDSYPVKSVLQRANAIICVSNYTAQLVQNIDKSTKDKITVVSNSINVSQYKSISNQYIQRENLIISVGRLSKEKNLDTAILAFSKLSKEIRDKYKYYIIGGGKEKKNLQNLVKKLKLTDSIKFFGNVDENKKITLLSRSKYFLLCPRIKKKEEEGFGIAFLEAHAAGLPIVTSKIGGIRDAVGDVGVYIDNPEDPMQISRALTKLITDDELAVELAIKGSIRVENFDHRIWINKIKKLYDELIYSKI
jgi:glycosyltransferase involved in cell wall biosynthesis